MIDEGLDLVKIIINNIPGNFNHLLEKARFIYIQLGKILEFDTTFSNTTKFNKFIIKNKRYDIHNLKDTKIVCHTWADIYVALLNEVGIKAYKVNKNHAWVIIKIDNMLIYADATIGIYTDLSRIQHNDETINFYPVSSNKTEGLPQRIYIENFQNLIREIDRKMGYQKTQYEYLQQLKKQVKMFETLREKVDYLLTQINVIGRYYEDVSYINYIFTFCLTFEERKKMSSCELKKTQNDGTVDLIRCISVTEDDSLYYYLFNKNNGISQIQKQDIMNYANNSYGISKGSDSLDLFDYPIIFKVPKNNFLTIFNNIFSFQNKILNDKKLNKKFYN